MRLYFRFLNGNIFLTLKLTGLEFDITQYRLLKDHDITWKKSPCVDGRKSEHFSEETFL